MERPSWAPEEIDLDRPSAARTYDYLLGGSHNFAADREAARATLQVMPQAGDNARENRGFMNRAVRYLLAAGVRQFLDIGSGIPTVGNVHEVAHRIDPTARIVYVDTDPIAVTHSRAILADNDRATIIQQDLRQPDAILEHPDLRAMLDLDQPGETASTARVRPTLPRPKSARSGRSRWFYQRSRRSSSVAVRSGDGQAG